MTRRLASPVALLAGCLLVLGACIHPDLAAGVLTPDTGHPDDRYDLDVQDGGARLVASAPATNTGGNTRWAFWRKADAARLDQQVCTTWVDGDITTTQQQGVALRIRQDGARTRAITVTRHVFGGFGGQFNVHVMDSAPAGGGGATFTFIGGAIITSLADETTPYPWRVCARVIGDRVDFLVWPTSQPRPAWGTAGAGGSTTLPDGWDAAGIPGFYIGHLPAGDSVGYTDIAVGRP